MYALAQRVRFSRDWRGSSGVNYCIADEVFFAVASVVTAIAMAYIVLHL